METWMESDVPGYLVSTEGRLAKLMSLTPGKGGYVQLSMPTAPGARTRIRRYLHDLVLSTFVGPRPPGAVARHLNDVRADNRLENLAWGSRSENQHDAFRNGKRIRAKLCAYGHPLEGVNLNGRRCRACQRARAAARYSGVACTQELRDRAYTTLLQEGAPT